MNHLTTLLKHLRLFWRWGNGIKISDAKFIRRYLELFLGGGRYKNLRENQVGGICFRSPTVSGAANNFSLRKKNAPRKPEIFYTTFDCYHLDQDRTRPGPEYYLCYQAQARADSILRFRFTVNMSAKTPRPASADAIASIKHASPVSASRETYFKLHTPLTLCSVLRAFASSVCGPL
jgi:hypothetical protein